MTMTATEPTEKQVAFIIRLRDERVLPDGWVARLDEVMPILTKASASKVIEALLLLPVREGVEAKPAKPSTGLDLSNLPSGRYAVPGDETRLKIQIQNVDKGKWAGWIFVKDGSEYGDQERFGTQRPGENYRGSKVEHLTKIVADPQAAMRKYGEITGTCGNCGLKLENEESVQYGIGPVCRKNLGW